MIAQEFTLNDYGWFVRVYYAEDGYDYDTLRRDLYSLGGELDEIDDLLISLEEEGNNAGVTRSNIFQKRSVIIIGPTSSAADFQDTYDHEKGHLAMHICIAEDIDPFSEEYQYLVGEIGRRMFKVAKDYLCENCRNKDSKKE